MDPRDFDEFWQHLAPPAEVPHKNTPPVAHLYRLENEVGRCEPALGYRDICRCWTHPATVHDIAIKMGRSAEYIRQASLELRAWHMLDEMGGDRYITNHEGLVHSRPDIESALVLHVLMSSRGHSLYIDQLQVRTGIREHRLLYQALQGLIEDGVVSSEGVRYTLSRIPISAARISPADQSLPDHP